MSEPTPNVPEPAAPDQAGVSEALDRAARDQGAGEVVLRVEITRRPGPLSPARRAARDAEMAALPACLLGPPADSI
jgi:hypothetical protein